MLVILMLTTMIFEFELDFTTGRLAFYISIVSLPKLWKFYAGILGGSSNSNRPTLWDSNISRSSFPKSSLPSSSHSWSAGESWSPTRYTAVNSPPCWATF